MNKILWCIFSFLLMLSITSICFSENNNHDESEGKAEISTGSTRETDSRDYNDDHVCNTEPKVTTDPGETFWSYYGLEKNADILSTQPRIDDGKCNVSTPFFEGNVPPNLSANKSFVLIARRGNGKTHLLCRLKGELLKDETNFIVEPTSNPIWLQKALEIFFRNTCSTQNQREDNSNVSNTKSVDSNSKIIDCISNNWRDKDILGFVISQIVYEVLTNIDTFKLDNLTLEDSLELFAIICLYYPSNNAYSIKYDVLNKIVPVSRSFWGKLPFTRKYNIHDISNIEDNDPSYMRIKSISDGITVLNHSDSARKKLIKILCNTLKHLNKNIDDVIVVVEEQNIARTDEEILLIHCVNLIKRAGRKLVLAIDGLDEVNTFGILNENCLSDPYSSFIKSTKVLLDMASTQQFQFILFVPDCPGNKSIDEILPEWRNSKVLAFDLNWNKNTLENYANFLLKHIASSQAKDKPKLPTFSELMGERECANTFLEKVSNPREFNHLLSKFILQLNAENNSNKTGMPFMGSQNCSTLNETIRGPEKNSPASEKKEQSYYDYLSSFFQKKKK